ncbi:sugar transferase [Microbacterium sp. 179-I 1D1 NHS]|uniref:sugar transferase n=1 Tax=unclassified Microbacterium TaxID=2609290 RepID=UPI00387914BF
MADTMTTDSEESGATVVRVRRTEPVRNWRRTYARRLWLSDLLVLIWVVYGTQIAWFGLGAADLAIQTGRVAGEVSYWGFSAALILVWMLTLSLADTRDHRVIGAGSAEYARLTRSSVTLFGIIAIVAFLTQIEVARGFLLLSLPLGILVLLFERWLWRQWLIAQRRSGAYSARVLLVGSRRSVVDIAHELLRTPSAGYHVVGACVPGGATADAIEGTDIPIMGSLSALSAALEESAADTVVVTSTDELPADKVKQISWGLEAGRQHLVLAPGIADIAGPRISSRPVAGLPLLHVETPRFSGGQRVTKRVMDVAAASLGVALISPILAFLAISIRLSSPGPVLFRQKRIGHGGREFTMLKFRSMVTDAEDRLAALMEQDRDAGNSVLFKMKKDPRVTPIGRIMRRLSLDELPQLFNVIGGSMSLVGPRPPLPREVELYADHVHRRFLVKPGITGLWQVSGRSSLSWEESVRLDLSYVENWTLVGDFVILVKTVRAALAPGETAF